MYFNTRQRTDLTDWIGAIEVQDTRPGLLDLTCIRELELRNLLRSRRHCTIQRGGETVVHEVILDLSDQHGNEGYTLRLTIRGRILTIMRERRHLSLDLLGLSLWPLSGQKII